MKNILQFTVLLIPVFLIFSFSPKEKLIEDFQKCKVLKKSLNKEYEGDCKKGLAHGQGIAKGEKDYYKGTFKKGLPYGKGKYVWGNGEFYQGDFKNGVRHGKGLMYTFNKETGAVEKGKLSLWKDDEFVMEVMEEKYKIIRQRNLVGVQAKKNDEEKNRVEISIKNGVEIRDMVIIHDVGSLIKFRDDKFAIDYVKFPINIVVNYTSTNKFNANRIATVVELQIESPGDWTVVLSH